MSRSHGAPSGAPFLFILFSYLLSASFYDDRHRMRRLGWWVFLEVFLCGLCVLSIMCKRLLMHWLIYHWHCWCGVRISPLTLFFVVYF